MGQSRSGLCGMKLSARGTQRQVRLPHLAHALSNSLRFPSIERFDEYYATDLLVDDGRAKGYGDRNAQRADVLFLARALILAGGGAGRIFPFTTNGAIKTGDGMAMAYRAGVPLKDMEFVQYHPPAYPIPEYCSLRVVVARAVPGHRMGAVTCRLWHGAGNPVGQPQLKTMELGPRDD